MNKTHMRLVNWATDHIRMRPAIQQRDLDQFNLPIEHRYMAQRIPIAYPIWSEDTAFFHNFTSVDRGHGLECLAIIEHNNGEIELQPATFIKFTRGDSHE